jgi:hypothetical protein
LCGKDSPCPFAEESFCVVLTEGDQGVCTRKCTPGGTECPPWLTCVALDPDKPEVGACFDVVDPGAGTCDPMAGKVCPNGLQCALVEEGTEGVCASYCSIGESLCPEGLECTPVEPGQVEWGMCLAKDDVPECWGDNNCEGLAVCVTLSDGFAGCVPQCVEDGEPCEDFGMCVTYPGPDGAVIGCLDIQKEGEICDPKKGLPCEDGLSCASVAGDALWKRCVAPCEGGQCGVGFLCQTGEGLPPEGMCVSVDLALSEPEACNPDFPCKDASSVCVSVPGSVNGVCAPPCSAGCPAGTGCRDGGCVAVAPAGAPCVESKGLFCVQGTACIRDAGENGTGYCAVLCNAGDDTVCKAPDVCLETGAGAYCLTSAGPGGKCSLDDGTGCDGAAGDLCVKMAASADAGYCAGKCDGPGSGTCVADKPLLIECVVKKGAQYYCGYLCGMAGAECPPDLTCSGMGLCIP